MRRLMDSVCETLELMIMDDLKPGDTVMFRLCGGVSPYVEGLDDSLKPYMVLTVFEVTKSQLR